MELSLAFIATKIAVQVPDARVVIAAGEMPRLQSVGIFSCHATGTRSNQDVGETARIAYANGSGPGVGSNADGHMLLFDLASQGDGIPHSCSEDMTGFSEAHGSYAVELRACSERLSVVTTFSHERGFAGCNLIVVPDQTDLARLLGSVSELFARFSQWADAVCHCIMRQGSLQEIADLTAPMVGNPLYISDSSFKMLASSSDVLDRVDPVWRYHHAYGYLPYNVMESLISTGELEQLNACESARIFRDTRSFQSPFVCRAIMREERRYGFFVIIGLNSFLDVCDCEVADYLGSVLAAALDEDDGYLVASSFYPAKFLEEIVAGNLVDEEVIAEQMKALGWGMEGRYLLFAMDVACDDEAVRHQLIVCLSGLGARCFAYGGNLVSLFSLDQADRQMSYRELRAQVERLVKAFNRYGALSDCFARVSALRSAYLQAEYALHCAERDSERARLMSSGEVFLDLLEHRCAGLLPEPLQVTVLCRYDEAHGTELCRTLYAWLSCFCNNITTAQRLFVHRNTINYRIERIRQLVDIDLDDPGSCLRVLLALHTTLFGDEDA